MTIVDVSERVRRLVETGGLVADGGPWVRLRPEAAAEAAPGGRPPGPLDGLVVAVKDLVAVAGLPIGAGSLARRDAAPEPRDAPVVARLRQAGAVVAGTVALHELAFGTSGVNDQVGFPPNPHDPERIPGGSSSGSAVAVAIGDCDLAMGTDTGGSVRIPAALCGVVGFKPSRHRYPLDGVLALSPTLDHVGLLARDVPTLVAAHQALIGDPIPGTLPGPPDPSAASPGASGAEGQPRAGEGIVASSPARVGVDRAGLERADAPVAVAVEAALRALADVGCELVELDWPAPEEAVEVSTTILVGEAARTFRDLLDGSARRLLGPDVGARLEAGAAITDGDLQAAQAERVRIDAAARRALATVDVVVGPMVPVLAPRIAAARRHPSVSRSLVTCTRVGNLTGLPSLTLPIAGAELPVGLQLMAPTDEATLAAGLALSPLLPPPSPLGGPVPTQW